MKLVAPFLLSIVLALPASLHAQVTARQGDPSESAAQEFKSPMILDLPLKDFQRLTSGSGKDFKEVQKYYCDDLTISHLVVVKNEDKRRGKPAGLHLEINGSVYVRPSYDRLATLRFDVVKGEERFTTTQVSDLSAGEGKTRSFKADLHLQPETLDRLFAEGAPALLRVVVTVQDNR
jgi:hypothetical protein